MEMLSALLLCGDMGTLGVTQKVLEEYGMSVRVAPSAPAADQLMQRTRFDLAVFDSDVPGAMQLAAPDSSHAPKMIFGLVRALKTDVIVGKRVHFIVQKPFTADILGKSLRAAYGSMLRERRAAFRHPVNINASSCVLLLEAGERSVPNARILDVSQTGLCLETEETLPQGAMLQIGFAIPNSKDGIHLTGSVMWNQNSGKAGIKFARMESGEQIKLNTWLESIGPGDAELVGRGAGRQSSY